MLMEHAIQIILDILLLHTLGLFWIKKCTSEDLLYHQHDMLGKLCLNQQSFFSLNMDECGVNL